MGRVVDGLRVSESVGGSANLTIPLGRVAELADAQASGACVLRDVGVQVPPRPPCRLLSDSRLRSTV